MFVGHGSPMNAIDQNTFTKTWAKLGQRFTPRAILMVSAHWFINETAVQNEVFPEKINDMYGFPEALYTLSYPVKGAPWLSEALMEIPGLVINNAWGIDHGAWSVLTHMYPSAQIPVVQLSINKTLAPQDHYTLGKALKPLRDQGVMIMGSGNIVHHLGRVQFNHPSGFDWALAFDGAIKQFILTHDHDKVIHYKALGQSAQFSVPTTDHFDPLLYCLGATSDSDTITVFNEGCIMGSLSMTSYLFES